MKWLIDDPMLDLLLAAFVVLLIAEYIPRLASKLPNPRRPKRWNKNR